MVQKSHPAPADVGMYKKTFKKIPGDIIPTSAG